MGFLSNLRTWAKRIKRDGLTLWFALRHPRTPLHSKVLAGIVVAYALSPIDLIPDFIPVLGYLDEVILLPGMIWLAIRSIPADVKLDCQRQGDEWMAQNGAKPRTKWGFVLVGAVWIGVAVLAWHWLAPYFGA